MGGVEEFGSREEWRKSSYSMGASQTCVEVSIRVDGVMVRNSKHPTGPVLQFTRQEWQAFLEGVRASEFDV